MNKTTRIFNRKQCYGVLYCREVGILMETKNKDTSEFLFKGKHADYVRKLTSELGTRTKFKNFQHNVEVLIFAPIVGMIYGRKASVDNNVSIIPIKINYQQLTNRSSALDYNKEENQNKKGNVKKNIMIFNILLKE